MSKITFDLTQSPEKEYKDMKLPETKFQDNLLLEIDTRNDENLNFEFENMKMSPISPKDSLSPNKFKSFKGSSLKLKDSLRSPLKKTTSVIQSTVNVHEEIEEEEVPKGIRVVSQSRRIRTKLESENLYYRVSDL